MGDILFLAHRVPFPPDRGDKIRSHHLLARLARLAPVRVGALVESAQDRAGEAELARIAASHFAPRRAKPLALAGIEAVIAGKPVSLAAFHSAALERWVRRTLAEHEVDTIVVFSGQMGQYVPEDFAGRVVIDLCDVDSAKFAGYAEAGQRAWLNRREARLLAREEERLAARADATILISEPEADLLRPRLPAAAAARLHVIGNGIDAARFDPCTSAPHPALAARPGPHFVFTGQMDYRPNETAAKWASRELLPRLRAHFARAEFHVVGRNPSRAVAALDEREGVTVWGEVPDTRPFLAAADVVLAPLDIARGVQNKVLEAMAMARPVLLSPAAATGIAAADGTDFLVSELDPGTMAQAAARLLADPARAAAMGAAARRFVLERHGWDALLAPLETLVSAGPEGVRHAA
ncbi:TIGR03087 family PEP-CTERM/XrtA system glycosyltransferase [Erythrobacter sp. HL-111]|uniref:TIGR03087 family PEP-CTERM/XrtA system glycosyltransferase n=1 Tax=Erythrobacter sp. HL-111 TaxID=1798193 RepID=UPI0006DB4BEC|nr:TIGR03087 family PEP-CTERM/XrtA system glycosyltransferase [Erythrobacter sp. HL-111]KPP96587.1 MAG: Glycosyltransferase [Erythrobacteraceae bacterium HL-111]SDS02672.1 sugar transferase, PEP-CTERM/EpsH1 system associated [Erythrobacter sp. HL-111]